MRYSTQYTVYMEGGKDSCEIQHTVYREGVKDSCEVQYIIHSIQEGREGLL